MTNRLLAIILFVSLAFAAGAGAQTAPADSAQAEPEKMAQVEPADTTQAEPAETDSAEIPADTVASDPLVKGKTGILSIDTLPVNEWDIPTKHNSLALTMLLSILPGGGQYYTEHYVRGGFITGIELLLIYEVYYNKSWQKDRVLEQAQPFRDTVSIYSELIRNTQDRDSIAYYQGQRNKYANRVREKSDKKMEQEDLRYAENAWLFGLHLY